MKNFIILVSQVVENKTLPTEKDGEILRKKIIDTWSKGKAVLDFYGIKKINEKFIENMIKDFYETYPHNFIKTRLSVINAKENFINTIRLVAQNAKTAKISHKKNKYDINIPLYIENANMAKFGGKEHIISYDPVVDKTKK